MQGFLQKLHRQTTTAIHIKRLKQGQSKFSFVIDDMKLNNGKRIEKKRFKIKLLTLSIFFVLVF